MKPAGFAYERPHSLEEALELLTEHGFDAKILAGGQSLVPTMNFRLAQPAVLVDLNWIDELSYIEPADNGGVRIGAMTRQRDVENSSLVAERSPLVTETMPFIAHAQIRNRATFGGSIAHADPAAELPAVALALDGRFKIASKDMSRWEDAEDFFWGMMTTSIQPSEMLVEVELPAMPDRSGWAFTEVARRHGDYALMGVAAVVGLDEDGTCNHARLVYLSAGDAPIPAEQAALSLVDSSLDDTDLDDAASIASEQDLDPPSDIHASAKYRRHLAKVLTKRALETARQRLDH